MDSDLNVFAEMFDQPIDPIEKVPAFKDPEGDRFSLAVAMGLMIDDKDI